MVGISRSNVDFLSLMTKSLDVSHGGQGATLFPLGDRLLFGQYNMCINLGGIANISYEGQGGRLAFDICPCHMVLNHYSQQLGIPYDDKGSISRSGVIDTGLLEELNLLNYYDFKLPKNFGV